MFEGDDLGYDGNDDYIGSDVSIEEVFEDIGDAIDTFGEIFDGMVDDFFSSNEFDEILKEGLKYSCQYDYNPRAAKETYEQIKTNNVKIEKGLFSKKKNQRVIGISSKNVKGQNYKNVVALLLSQGFINIRLRPIENIGKLNKAKDGIVQSMIVDGKKNFPETKKFELFVPIIVTYRSRPRVQMPFDSGDIVNYGYTVKNVVSQLKSAGFDNVNYTIVNDVKKGGFFSGNKQYIDSFTVAGNSVFDKKTKYHPSVEIIFVSHEYAMER